MHTGIQIKTIATLFRDWPAIPLRAEVFFWNNLSPEATPWGQTLNIAGVQAIPAGAQPRHLMNRQHFLFIFRFCLFLYEGTCGICFSQYFSRGYHDTEVYLSPSKTTIWPYLFVGLLRGFRLDILMLVMFEVVRGLDTPHWNCILLGIRSETARTGAGFVLPCLNSFDFLLLTIQTFSECLLMFLATLLIGFGSFPYVVSDLCTFVPS